MTRTWIDLEMTEYDKRKEVQCQKIQDLVLQETEVHDWSDQEMRKRKMSQMEIEKMEMY